MALVLDSSAVSYLARRTPATLALITALRDRGVWSPLVPSPVLIECLTGDGSRDAATHRLLRSVNILEAVPVGLARRAAHLRTEAHRGSAIDALVVATSEPGGTVLTGDARDIRALAQHAQDVGVEAI